MTPRQLRFGAIAGGLLAAQGAYAVQDGDGFDDPFATRALAGGSASASTHMDIESESCPGHGQVKKSWSLIDVIIQALCHNPQTREAWLNARIQAALVGVGEAAYLPSISINTQISGSQNFQGGSLATPIQSSGATPAAIPTQYRVLPILSLNYLLFDFGGRAARLENARHALEAANWTHDLSIQTVLFAAVQAYYQLFAAQAAAESARIAEASSAAAVDAAHVRREVGSAALADELQAKTAWSQAKLNQQQANGTAKVALGTLANVMGMEPRDDLKILPPTFQQPDRERERDVQELIDEARALRPDLSAAEAQVRAARANVDAVRASGLPTVSLLGNYSYGWNNVSNSTNSWSVGFQVSVPLFTGFANTYQIRAAQDQVAFQEASRDQLQQSVGLDVWTAFYNLRTIRETLESAETLLTSASQSEAVALERYKAGAGNVLDVLTTQASLANARFQRIQAQFNWAIGKARLAQAIGSLDLPEIQTETEAPAPPRKGRSR